jgi:precorrin-3B synthase
VGFPLRDGRSALAVALPFGHADARELIAFAASAEEFGVSEIRIAPARTILALCTDGAAAERLRGEAARLGFLVDAADPRAAIAACPGAPACASGLIPARDLAARIAEAHADLLDGSLDIHVSGCAKGCAHPAPAALTLVGCEGGAGLVVDGNARMTPLASIPAGQTLESVGRIAGLLRAARRPGETTAGCAARLGGERLAKAFGKE